MFEVTHLIESGGLLLVGLIVFAESGLLIGFFLPGDTLLFTAGFFASQGKLPLGLLLFVIVAAAVIGDNVGYSIGKHAGKRLFKKKDGLLFRHEYVERAEKFYEEHGGKTIVLARFVPIVRTFAPMVAGVGKMSRSRFLFFNIFGAGFWGVSVTMLGFWLGQRIPNIDKYLLPVILGAVLFSFGPTIWHIAKDPVLRQTLKDKILRRNKQSG